MKKSILFLICSVILIALNDCTNDRAIVSQRETSDASESVEVVTESETTGAQSELRV